MPEILKAKRKKNKESKPVIVYLLNALKGLILTLVLLGIISIILLNNASFTVFYKAFSYIAVGFGGAFSGFCAYRRLKGRGIVNGAICGALFGVILCIILLVVMGFNVNINLIYILPLSIVCGLVGGIVGANL